MPWIWNRLGLVSRVSPCPYDGHRTEEAVKPLSQHPQSPEWVHVWPGPPSHLVLGRYGILVAILGGHAGDSAKFPVFGGFLEVLWRGWTECGWKNSHRLERFSRMFLDWHWIRIVTCFRFLFFSFSESERLSFRAKESSVFTWKVHLKGKSILLNQWERQAV